MQHELHIHETWPGASTRRLPRSILPRRSPNLPTRHSPSAPLATWDAEPEPWSAIRRASSQIASRTRDTTRRLDVVDAGTACMDLAVPALENPPRGTCMAQVTGPLDQCAVGFDHLERVGAVVGDGHGVRCWK
jgi:hypothetical protein